MLTKTVDIDKVVGKGYASFWKDKHRYRVLKGGRGSKKSTTSAIWFIHHIMKYNKANVLVVRKTGNTHKDSTFAMLKWAASRLEVAHLWHFKENPMEAIYKPTGQKILFRGFDDPLKLTSITVSVGVLCWVWIEEAYELDNEAEFNTLNETIRGEMPDGLWKQITLTYNPWINSHWTKTRFFDNTDPEAFTLTTTYKCNEWLDDADRKLIEDMEHTNPERFKVVGLGEYGMPGGTYFDEFRKDIHVIKPFVIPDFWNRYRVMDYGLDMLACYWIAVDTQKHAYVYKELYESDLIISQAAKRILEVNGKDYIIQHFAPPDMWSRRQDTGKSADDIYRENGVYLSESKNNRVMGWYSVKEWLRVYDTKDEQTGVSIRTANIKIFNNCTNLIRCMESIIKDERDPNDCAVEPHKVTHAPDALRYWCIMHHSAADVPRVEEDEDEDDLRRYGKKNEESWYD